MRMPAISLALSLLPYAIGIAVLCAVPMAGGAQKSCAERLAQAIACNPLEGRGCTMRLY